MPERAAAALVLLVLALSGCAHQSRQPLLKLKTLTDKLAGSYDNSAQVTQDLERGVASPHLGLSLQITAAHAVAISDTMFYVRESVAADPRRVLSQRLWKLSEDNKHHRIMQTMYVFKEPRRWLQASDQPELLLSLTLDDVEELQGCDLVWNETEGLLRAVAAKGGCRPSALTEGMLLEQRVAIQDHELSLGESEVAADGTITAPALFDGDVDFYRFVRHGTPPKPLPGSAP